MKGSLLFILGAAVGMLGYGLANSPFDPFYDWIKDTECQTYYSDLYGITDEEFKKRLQVGTTPTAP